MSPQAVGAEYARCRAWLLPAMVDATEEEVFAELMANRAQLWAGDASAMITQLLAPATMHVWIAGGALRDLLELRPGVEAWARAQGCKAITINGRPGWLRVLNSLGYAWDGEELRKVL